MRNVKCILFIYYEGKLDFKIAKYLKKYIEVYLNYYNLV